MAGNAIEIRNFSLSIGEKHIIDDVSFSVKKGDVFGFLGANGAGKTTTIRALLGLIAPTKGTLAIDGKRFTVRTTAHIGYLPEERGLYRKETVLDVLIYLATLKGLPKQEAKKRALAYLERVGLQDKATERIGRLSGGQQQKIQMGAAILHRPSLLILDEPTKGLDPVNQALLMDIINEQREAGTTIFLVTHDMDDVERLCDQIALLKAGQLLFSGTVREIKTTYGKRILGVSYEGALPEKLPAGLQLHQKYPQYAEFVQQQDVEPVEQLSQIAALSNVVVTGFETKQTSLADIFIQLYGGQEVA